MIPKRRVSPSDGAENVHPSKDTQIEAQQDGANGQLERARSLCRRAAESKWGFVRIARENPKDAKDAMGSALTTTGVVSALMLTFTFPLIVSPPEAILDAEEVMAEFRTE